MVPGDKTGGGKLWTAATADELSADLFAMATAVIEGLQQAGSPVFTNLTILLPVAQHALISQKRMGPNTAKTVLRFVIENSPYITAIEPWRHCKGAGAGSTDRAVIYPRNPLVVAGIVPMETQPMSPVQKGIEFIVNMLASCGGVVVRYPLSIKYMDGI